MSDLPYRYSLLLHVTIVGDGVSASGDGVIATTTRLNRLLETDSHVESTWQLPDEINYLGRTDGE